MHQPAREHRLEELKLEFAARFEAICRHLTSDEFAKLVAEMAQFRLKHESLDAGVAPESGSGLLPRKPAS